jgi:hypothetical protein
MNILVGRTVPQTENPWSRTRSADPTAMCVVSNTPW